MEQNNKKAILCAVILIGLIIICFEIYSGFKGVEPSGKVEEIWALIFITFSIYWIIMDARVRKMGSPFTNGFIMYVLWPLMVPFYFLKIKGKKGFFLILGLFTTFVTPEIVWAIAYYFS